MAKCENHLFFITGLMRICIYIFYSFKLAHLGYGLRILLHGTYELFYLKVISITANSKEQGQLPTLFHLPYLF